MIMLVHRCSHLIARVGPIHGCLIQKIVIILCIILFKFKHRKLAKQGNPFAGMHRI